MKYYKRVNNGQTTTVESYSHDLPVAGAIEINKAEYDAFIAALPAPEVIIPRDPLKELDELKAALISKGVIQ